jgi:hypothetical protein
VDEFVGILQVHGVLVLVGSTGTGKTTLAKLTAGRCGGEWRWISFSTVDSADYARAFRSLAVLLERDPEANSILLDDVNLLPRHSRQLEDYLAGVLYTIIQRKGRLVITSQKTLPHRLSQHLRLAETSTRVAPAMTHEEITDLAVQLGCQSRDNARAWAAITLVHTSGHVQLVHAQMKNLVRQGWPQPSGENVFKQPVEVGQALSEGRMLLKELPDGHRDLLYRLSLVAGLFRRDHAIAIGELKPAVPRVGDAFDELLGPWIEHVDREYMRVSPLLKGCANQVWSENTVKELHQAIGFSILQCAPRTQWEASTVLMHGIASGSGPLIILVVNSILGGAEKMIAAVAPTLSWLKAFIKPGAQIFPKDKSVNFMLRLLQFRVAAQLEPETTAVEALAVWESDPMPDSPPEFAICARSLYLGSLLLQIKVPIAPRKLVRAIVETANLAENFPPLKETFVKAGALTNTPGQKQPFDWISVGLMTTLGRPASVQFFEEWLDALEQDAPDAIRARMLAAMRPDAPLIRMFLDAVWFEESKSPTPNWPNCIRVFEKCITLAKRWNVSELIYSAARGIAIIRDEYQDDQRGALAVLDLHAPREGPSSITIENERATVLLHAKDFKEAVASWERILPVWQNLPATEDTAVLFALNKAGEAAARAEDWTKAAALFGDGVSRASLLRQQTQAVGFAVDAGWALWKAREYHRAFDLFHKSLVAADVLPDPKTNPYIAKVQRVLGHLLVCTKREIEREDYGEVGEPCPGMASNPDASDKWQEPPLNCCFAFLAEIECYLKLAPSLFQEVRTRFAGTRIPMIHCIITELAIRYAFRELRFDNLPLLANELDNWLRVSKAQKQKGQTDLGEADMLPGTSTEQSGSVAPTLLTHALIASLAGSITPQVLIETWRESSARFTGFPWLNTWLDSTKRVFVVSPAEALEIMGDNNQTSEMRFLAAARLMSDPDAGVDRMFNAQVWLVGWVGHSKLFWNYDLGEYVAAIISRTWKKQCAFKATLRNPRLAVPAIERECESKDGGIAKASRVLLAVADAVTIRLSEDVRKQLHTFASTQIVNPYRFA